MRAYFINNMYLSSIQNGIQAAHVVHELFRKYQKQDALQYALHDWADNFKTMIVLNGGMTEHLVSFLELVKKSGLPFDTFNEPGIGNALTSIGVIVPERLYGHDEIIGIIEDTELSNEEKQFLIALKQFSLAK
jgi:hypothetical protein